MNFIDRLVFPKPKPCIPLDFEEEVIFVPCLKEPVSYRILREVLLYKQMESYSSDQNEFQNSQRIKQESQVEAPPVNLGQQSNPSFVNPKAIPIDSETNFTSIPRKSDLSSKPSNKLPPSLANHNETLDFVQTKKSAVNMLHEEFEKKLVVVNREKAKTLLVDSDVIYFSMKQSNFSQHLNHQSSSQSKEDLVIRQENIPTIESLPDSQPFQMEKSRVHQSKSNTVISQINRSQTQNLDLLGFASNPLINLDIKLLKSQLLYNIPVLYYPNPTTRMTLVYFHSNAEDITMLESLCEYIRDSLNCSVFAMEYAGYSLHSQIQTSVEAICKDAENLIHFLRKTLELKTEEIMIMGRSIGSGPAFHVASKFTFHMIIIIAGFLSIKALVADRMSILGKVVGHYFDNEKMIELNKSPLLILHGRNDEITSPKHSEILYEKAKSKSKIVIFDDMPHNNFDFYGCVVEPIREFQKTLKKSPKKVHRVTSFDFEKVRLSNEMIWNLHSLLTANLLEEKLN